MPDSIPKLSFTGGELAPNLYNRTDLVKHGTAVRRMKNMFVRPQGAVSNRGGFKFINETLESAKKSKLFPFQFSVEQAYALEFGDKYIRVYANQGLVTEGPIGGTNLVDAGSFQWTAVATGGHVEYYLELLGGGDPGITTSFAALYEDANTENRPMVGGILGSLEKGEWSFGKIGGVPAWGNAYYVRLSDDVDPDTKEEGYLESAIIQPVGFGTDIVDAAVFRWVRIFILNEYYLEPLNPGQGSLRPPEHIYEDVGGANVLLTPGTVFHLSPGEWGYSTQAENVLGGVPINTIVVRLNDSTDPSAKADGYAEAVYIQPVGEGISRVDTEKFQWTVSTSGTPVGVEYYLEAFGGGFPVALPRQLPRSMWEDAGRTNTKLTAVVALNLGSLNAGEWTLGKNDGQTFPTLYVRLTDDSDPDSNTEGYVTVGFIEQITTSYREADLDRIQVSQSADVLYITHPSYPRQKLTRRAHDDWILSPVLSKTSIAAPTGLVETASGAGPTANWVVTAVSITGEESIASNRVTSDSGSTFNWTPVADADHYNFYKDDTFSGTYGWVGSAGTELFFEPPAFIIPDYSKAPPKTRTPFDEIDDYPGVSVFHEQRTVYARTNNAPQSLFGSVTGVPDNFNVSVPVQASDAYTFTLNSNQMNEITWLVSLSDLLIGTIGAEWRMRPGGDSNAITPSSVDVKPQTRWGSARKPPVVVGNSVIFLNRKQDILRDLQFSLEADGYKGNDLTIMARHLFDDYTITDMTYQPNDDSIIWCIRNDGKLLGLTYFKEHDVFGWHIHETDGKFESIVSLETTSGVSDLYVIVKRIIGGVTKRFIEVLHARLPLRDDGIRDIQDAFFVDSGLSLDRPGTITGATQASPVVITSVAHGLSNTDLVDIVEIEGMVELNDLRYKVANVAADTFELTDPEDDTDIDGTEFTVYTENGKAREAVTTISGLSHIEGKAVSVLANGFVIPNLVVASGAITLPTPASRVHVGLPYTSEMETLNFVTAIRGGGTSQDKVGVISSALVTLENTRALNIGPQTDRLETAPIRFTEDYGEAIGLFTGEMEVILDSGEPRAPRLVIQNTDPIPITVTSITARMDHGEA